MESNNFNPYQLTFKKGTLNTHHGILHRQIPIVIADWDELIDVPDRVLAYIGATSNLANIDIGDVYPKRSIMYAWYRIYPEGGKAILTTEFISTKAQNMYPTYFLGYYILRWKDILRITNRSESTTIVLDAPDGMKPLLSVNTIDIESIKKDKDLYQTCQLLKANLISAGLNISLIGDGPI